MKKHQKITFLSLLLIVMMVMPVMAEEYPHWIQQWRDFAKKSGNPDYMEWADRISTPKAIQLGKEWEEFLGYNAVDLVAKDKKAPSIKPGLVITPENIDKYEKELRELFPYGLDWEVDKLKGGAFGYNSANEMVIVPTHHGYQDRGYLEATKKYYKNCKLDEKGDLQGFVAGIPFPFPKTGLEMVHNYDRLTIMADNLNSMPCEFGLYGTKGTQERVEKIELHWKNYSGRIKIKPFPVIPGFKDIYEKGSIVALYPYDLRGFAAVRTRFIDPEKEDSFITYIPSMRRIRRLAGSNTQDPLVGSDVTWEDWKGFWSKISVHKAKYEVVAEDVVLCPSFNPKPIVFSDKYGGRCRRFLWERRPVWIVKITYDEPTYLYGSRLWVLDKELFAPQQFMWWDQRGRPWKIWEWVWRWNPDEGELDYWDPWVVDVINRHMTIVKHTITLNMPNITENLFNLRYLSSKAH